MRDISVLSKPDTFPCLFLGYIYVVMMVGEAS